MEGQNTRTPHSNNKKNNEKFSIIYLAIKLKLYIFSYKLTTKENMHEIN